MTLLMVRVERTPLPVLVRSTVYRSSVPASKMFSFQAHAWPHRGGGEKGLRQHPQLSVVPRTPLSPPRPPAVTLTMRSGGGVLPMKHSTLPRSPRTAYCTASLEMMGGPAGGKGRGGLDRNPGLRGTHSCHGHHNRIRPSASRMGVWDGGGGLGGRHSPLTKRVTSRSPTPMRGTMALQTYCPASACVTDFRYSWLLLLRTWVQAPW